MTMSLDEIHDVDDHSEITVKAMIERLRRSRTEEHYIYRETELDEMWRIIDIALRRAELGADQRVKLAELRSAVERAHDLVGVDLQPLQAAAVLEAMLPKLPR